MVEEFRGVSYCEVKWHITYRLSPLPRYRPGGGKILVRRSEFDRLMKSFRHDQAPITSLNPSTKHSKAPGLDDSDPV